MSRLYLSHMLATHFPQVEVVGYATTEAEALSQIQALRPDLIFLDIELQWGTGFGVIEKNAPEQGANYFHHRFRSGRRQAAFHERRELPAKTH